MFIAALRWLMLRLARSDPAFEMLDKSFKEQEIALLSLKVDPKFDPLRSDPRFDQVLERLGVGSN